MPAADGFILAMLLIFAVPSLLRRLAHTDRIAPFPVVQIAVGILLGPGVLGTRIPTLYSHVMTQGVRTLLTGVATWGVMLFVWIAGIELDLAAAWRRRKEAALTASLALGTPLLLGAAAGAILLFMPGWIGVAAAPWQFMLAVGMACAVTALPILVLFLEEMAVLHTIFGQRILCLASLDDVAIWTVLALVLMDRSRMWHQLAILSLLPITAWGLRRLIVRLPPAERWLLALCWMIAYALAADLGGLHFMAGAFLAGATMDRNWFPPETLAASRCIVLQLLMPVFFLITGLRTSWHLGSLGIIAAAALLLAAAIGGKLAGVIAAGRIFAWPRPEAIVIGWLLQTKALVMIIFANILLDRAIITSATFTALLLMALASTLLTMPMVRRAPGFADLITRC